MLLCSRFHFSEVDFKCGQAYHLSNTISRYHMDTVSDSDADLYAVNFVAGLSPSSLGSNPLNHTYESLVALGMASGRNCCKAPEKSGFVCTLHYIYITLQIF